jgi:phenylacetate-CoA ligase
MSTRGADGVARRAAWTAYAVAQIPVQRRAPFRSRSALERAQTRRVRSLITFAFEHVPYYRETMTRLRLAPDMFRTAADLAHLPIIERGLVQRDPERFLSTALPRERYVQLATDGSTGAPVLVWHDPFALFQGVGHYERGAAVAWKLARRRLTLRRALIGFPTGVVARTSDAVRSRSVVPAGLRYRELRLSMSDSLADNAERLLEFAPDEVRGYGSYLEELFLYIRASGRTAGLPRVIVFGDDAMSPLGRRMITDELGVPVLSEYDAGEAHHIAFECEAHRGLHVNEDICPIRVVDEDGADVPAGEPGEIVISNLVNRGTVLLNYRLGDVVTRLGPSCSCGRTLELISFPIGRTDEWCTTAGGELVHGQEVRGLLLADDAFLAGFQVVQESPLEFTVAAVLRDGADRQSFARGVKQRFAQRFGGGIRVRVTFVDSLARTAGGKVRPVVSQAGVRRPPRTLV